MPPSQHKPDRSCLSLVGLVVFTVAVVIALLALWLPEEPPERLVVSMTSPDGVYTASEFSVDLGATGGNTSIRLNRASGSPAEGQVVVVDTSATRLADLSWAGRRTLVVGVYDSANALVTHATAWHDVRIVYKKKSIPSE